MERNTPDFDLGLIERYFSGELTEQERVAFEQWCQESPARERIVEDLRAFWSSPEERGDLWELDLDTMWQCVAERIRSEYFSSGEMGISRAAGSSKKIFRPHSPRQGDFKTQPLRRTAWYIAAGVVIGLLGWNLGIQHGRQSSTTMSTYTTANGQRANITLPDGSTVALDVASRLQVPSDYQTGNRTVRMTGTAIFTVAHHSRVPFIVQAGGTATTVLGTTFLVRHYQTDTSTIIAVQDGKVAVSSATQSPTVLANGQQLVLGRAGAAHLESLNPAPFTFVRGVLTLKNMPLSQAIAELDRWYDADIRLGDPSLRTLRVTGENAAGSLEDLSNIFELTFKVHVVRQGRTLTLFPK